VLRVRARSDKGGVVRAWADDPRVNERALWQLLIDALRAIVAGGVTGLEQADVKLDEAQELLDSLKP
jgi:hypothetical protein